jgi:hypothetical protein
MAEQLRLHQVGRNIGAVDGDEGVIFACTELMDGPRDEFLTCATLTTNQQRRLGVRDTHHQSRQVLHNRTLTDDPL